MPAARLGPPSPLPPLSAPRSVFHRAALDESVPAEDRRYFGYGCDTGCLPYRLQDDYARLRRRRAFRALVLENDRLRATVLTELGGRLWSLYHKPSGRELLYVNLVFQPANLAIRNAWFTGGVEWNCCLLGHSVLTCSPVFAARVRRDDGLPILRLYEWNRVREVPFQIDLHLPDGSDFLFVRVRLTNPHDREVPAYWWSNISVPEREDVRVIAPADRAFHHEYDRRISLAFAPTVGGVDRSYPTNMSSSADLYFRIPAGRRPWIAAVDGEGRGLVHASTSRLFGRKLFMWGVGPGGRRWQDLLSLPGHPYVEIQGGLTHTQAECLPMPAGDEWAWLEAYGPVEAGPGEVHGPDWHAAWKAVEGRLDSTLPQEDLEDELACTAASAERPPDEILQRGSGWGALERLRRERSGERPFCSKALAFNDASLGEEQEPWLALLRDGGLPYREPAAPPGAYMVQAEWRKLLEEAVGEGRGDHWLSWLHLGVMRWAAGDPEAAGRAWERSVEREPSAWAFRNLAVLARNEKRHDDAAGLLKRALSMASEVRPLAVECCRALVRGGRSHEMLDVLATLPPEVRGSGRIRVLEAEARLRTGDLDEAERLLRDEFVVSDLRERENVLTQLWFAVQAKRMVREEGVPVDDNLLDRVQRESPPPAHIDFRMHAGSSAAKSMSSRERKLWFSLVVD